MRSCAFGFSILLMLCAFVGCGTPAPLESLIFPAKGKVSHNGKPLTKGRLIFEPEGAGRDASADIQPDGSYVMTTFQKDDGAARGSHRVYVDGLKKSELPAKFSTPGTSGTKVEIKADQTDYEVDFK